MACAILTGEQVWAKGSSNLQPSCWPEENAASSGVRRKEQCLIWKLYKFSKGSSLRAAFLSSCFKPSAEDRHTNRLYPVYSDDVSSNDTERKEK